MITAVTVFLFGNYLTPRALAYNNYDQQCGQWSYPGGYSQLTLYWVENQSYPPTGDYTTPYANARTSWYNTSTPISFSYSGSASTYHGVIYNGLDGRAGVTYVYCNGGYAASASVYLNRSYLEPGNGHACSTAFTRQYTAAHELGHNITLGHSSYSSAVMYWSYNCGSPPAYNAPQSDDVCGVNHLYPSDGWPPTCGY
jgi:hypothetical protein